MDRWLLGLVSCSLTMNVCAADQTKPRKRFNRALDEGKVVRIMRKLQTVVFALFAVCALSVAVASTASAETTLAAVWQKNGVNVAGSLGTTSEGEILQEDEGIASVLCSGILVGNVNTGGKDEITEVQNLSKQKIELGLRSLICTDVANCASAVEVWPEGLPWTTQLYLKENGTFADRMTKKNGGTFGYTVLCGAGTIFPVEDTCTATEGNLPIENNLDAETPAGSTVTPLANCIVGGKGKAKNTTDALTEIKLTNLELLTAAE